MELQETPEHCSAQKLLSFHIIIIIIVIIIIIINLIIDVFLIINV